MTVSSWVPVREPRLSHRANTPAMQLRRVVDVQGLRDCDALAYQDMCKRLPALPATLTQPVFLTISIGLLTELEAGKVKVSISAGALHAEVKSQLLVSLG